MRRCRVRRGGRTSVMCSRQKIFPQHKVRAGWTAYSKLVKDA
jgi:hypothetical protein